ncbi:MAG: hypothetical protein C0524_06045 [Rhodobacter sp.]|nr:hypothetical protein [Rhodobacter sp.]
MSLKLFDLGQKRALVAGSSLGIGFARAKGLVAAGAEVVLNGRDTDKLATAATALRQSGTTVHVLPFDATDHAGLRATIHVDGGTTASL